MPTPHAARIGALVVGALLTSSCVGFWVTRGEVDMGAEPAGPIHELGPIPGTDGLMARVFQHQAGGWCVDYHHGTSCGAGDPIGLNSWGGGPELWCFDALLNRDVERARWRTNNGQSGVVAALPGGQDLPFRVFVACLDSPMPDDLEVEPEDVAPE